MVLSVGYTVAISILLNLIVPSLSTPPLCQIFRTLWAFFVSLYTIHNCGLAVIRLGKVGLDGRELAEVGRGVYINKQVPVIHPLRGWAPGFFTINSLTPG